MDNNSENPGDQESANGEEPSTPKATDASEQDATPTDDTTGLKEELEKTAQRLADAEDQFLRARAEMENMRRRMAREKSDLLNFGNESILKDVLPVLDSFDKALDESGGGERSAEEQSFMEGFLLLKKQLLAVLEKHGLQAIQSVGEVFDPNLHQGIQRIESDDVEEEIVKEEFAKGYTLNGRLLRASMVSVSVPK